MVMLGSSMTLSPDFKILMEGLDLGTWSAIKGETFDLTPPVPIPMTMMATMKPAKEVSLEAIEGSEVMNKMKIPIIMITQKTQMVRYLPRNVSAIQAPKIGVT